MFLACLQFCWYFLLIYLLLCNLHVARHTGFLWGVNFLQLFVWDRLNGFLFGKRGREPCSLKVSFGISRAQVLELGLQCWSLPFLCILCGRGGWGGQVERWFMDSWIHSSWNLVFHCLFLCLCTLRGPHRCCRRPIPTVWQFLVEPGDHMAFYPHGKLIFLYFSENDL